MLQWQMRKGSDIHSFFKQTLTIELHDYDQVIERQDTYKIAMCKF